GEAMRRIRHGYADAVLVVGMEDCLNAVNLAANANLRALASGYEADPAAVDRMLALMAGVPAARARLETLPAVLRVAPAESARSAGAWGSIRDPWGRPLHCLTASSPLAVHRKAVAANQGRPIFISAGPDGRFGFQDVSAASDNIRSDEIGQ
ncbi:MAG TPA: hypothetical protein PLQ89_16180, partial [Phycisphaerae bacterium]|nr:hypothetical protein [Phycisphaerae bacterium]